MTVATGQRRSIRFLQLNSKITGVHPQPIHAVQQGATRQAEFTCGLALIATVLAQAVNEKVALDALEAFAQIQRTVQFIVHGAQAEMRR